VQFATHYTSHAGAGTLLCRRMGIGRASFQEFRASYYIYSNNEERLQWNGRFGAAPSREAKL
jgi:hypothetical protein